MTWGHEHPCAGLQGTVAKRTSGELTMQDQATRRSSSGQEAGRARRLPATVTQCEDSVNCQALASSRRHTTQHSVSGHSPAKSSSSSSATRHWYTLVPLLPPARLCPVRSLQTLTLLCLLSACPTVAAHQASRCMPRCCWEAVREHVMCRFGRQHFQSVECCQRGVPADGAAAWLRLECSHDSTGRHCRGHVGLQHVRLHPT